MVRHFVTLIAFGLLSYALWWALSGRPDIPLYWWLLTWVVIASVTYLISVVGTFVQQRHRRK